LRGREKNIELPVPRIAVKRLKTIHLCLWRMTMRSKMTPRTIIINSAVAKAHGMSDRNQEKLDSTTGEEGR
jgi:hypothetical protein